MAGGQPPICPTPPQLQGFNENDSKSGREVPSSNSCNSTTSYETPENPRRPRASSTHLHLSSAQSPGPQPGGPSPRPHLPALGSPPPPRAARGSRGGAAVPSQGAALGGLQESRPCWREPGNAAGGGGGGWQCGCGTGTVPMATPKPRPVYPL